AGGSLGCVWGVPGRGCPPWLTFSHPPRLTQWARREAEIQVRERERLGLPLLTSNYYDPARLSLPPPE
ncbi:NDUBB dehydrogenase, partial [Mionectes macconnelli]|nr:NDUBB dehydrogenase [Mionectes macconnelli]